LIADRYELLERLGRGSSAVVYSALDRHFNRRITIKLFDPAIGNDVGLRARFQQQSGKAARLRHPNIAAILDAGFTDALGARHQPFVVQEPAGDATLRSVLQRRGRLSPRRAIAVARQVAAALEYAHEAGVVHANVKPENVLVDGSGAAKLVDFSLSFVSAQTGAITRDTLAGRAAYLAPEQVRGEPVSPAVDVYALGVLLYEMLVGRPPFTGGSPEAIAERRVQEHARPAGLYDPSVPPAVEAVIARALERSADARWPSVAAFTEALERLGASELEPRELNDVDGPAMERRGHGRTGVLGGRSPVAMVVPVLAVALALGLVVAYVLPALRGTSRFSDLFDSTTVPDVVGMSVSDARKLAGERGLEFIVVGDRLTDRVPQGQIVQQAPVAGHQTSGQPLRVTVSAGVTVPDMRGKSVENATSALKDLGWKVARTERAPHPGHASGTVVLQHPPPGETATGPGEMLLAVAE
jgi:serine/threonine-protein kinase